LSDSDSFASDIEEAATSAVSSLLPGKSRIKYEHERFVRWCNQKGDKNETNEKTLLAYIENKLGKNE
jgi:hypothetical protein